MGSSHHEEAYFQSLHLGLLLLLHQVRRDHSHPRAPPPLWGHAAQRLSSLRQRHSTRSPCTQPLAGFQSPLVKQRQPPASLRADSPVRPRRLLQTRTPRNLFLIPRGLDVQAPGASSGPHWAEKSRGLSSWCCHPDHPKTSQDHSPLLPDPGCARPRGGLEPHLRRDSVHSTNQPSENTSSFPGHLCSLGLRDTCFIDLWSNRWTDRGSRSQKVQPGGGRAL